MYVEVWYVTDAKHENEFSRRKTFEKALEDAKKLAKRENQTMHVHWAQWEINRGGRWCVDSDPDRGGAWPDGTTF